MHKNYTDKQRLDIAKQQYNSYNEADPVKIEESKKSIGIVSQKNQQQINRGTILHHHRQIHATHSLHQRKKQSKRTNNPLQRFYRTG